ncbi:MAG: aminoacyl-tRNA hydrolase, partial [Brooklawnia sp.]|nr:aminoacyl-tRNA hydrolase [Brooklawnia sp.]
MTSWLLVGLGNPGPEYERTRHNVGFMIADELARRARASFSAPRGMRAAVATTVISAAGLGVPPGDKLIIAKPRTFMNESGQAVGKLAAFYQV